MKKLFLIFLLMVLPLQASWAVAAVYCQHENEMAASHFGHHEHEHAQSEDADDQADRTPSGKFHADCATCHGGIVGLSMAMANAARPVPSTVAAAAIPTFLNSPPPLRPERPKWSLAI